MKTILFFTAASIPTAGEAAQIAALNSLGAKPYRVQVLNGQPRIKKTATTISAATADHSLNDSANGFLTAGFKVGDVVTVRGFTGNNTPNNVERKTISSLTAGKMKFAGTSGDAIATEAAGASVSIETLETALYSGNTMPGDYVAGSVPASYYEDGAPIYDAFDINAVDPADLALPGTCAIVAHDQVIDVTGGGSVKLSIVDGEITGCAYTAPG